MCIIIRDVNLLHGQPGLVCEVLNRFVLFVLNLVLFGLNLGVCLSLRKEKKELNTH